MINIYLIQTFYDTKKQLENCFKKFVTQVIKDNDYTKNMKVYSVNVQTDGNEIVIDIVFEAGIGATTEETFYIDFEHLEGAENSLKKQIREFLIYEMEDEDD